MLVSKNVRHACPCVDKYQADCLFKVLGFVFWFLTEILSRLVAMNVFGIIAFAIVR